METSGIDKFFLEVFKTNRVYVLEQWEKWQSFVNETLKADVDKAYPQGFKDFLVEQMDTEIKSRTKTIAKNEKNSKKSKA